MDRMYDDNENIRKWRRARSTAMQSSLNENMKQRNHGCDYPY